MTTSTPATPATTKTSAVARAAVAAPTAHRWRPEAYVAVGALAGLVWAASLRGWMVELAGPESTFGWMTFAFVLAPGAAVGALLGLAAYRRPHRARTDRWLALAPALFATAIFDPKIFRALVTTGMGGGALMVVATALAGGFVLGRSRWSVGRVLCAVVLVCGLLLLGLMGSMVGPLSTARAAWVCLLGFSLMVVLCAAAAVPYPGRRWRGWQLAGLGAFAGLAWAGALRSFMAAVAGAESGVTWVLTFGYILLPGAVVGALLGWAAHLRPRGDDRWRWRLAWSPMLFAAVLFSDPLHFAEIFEDGIGAGAAAVPFFAVLGGYAVSAGGRRWLRAVAGLVFVGSWFLWLLTAESVGGPRLSPGTAHGLWASVLYLGLLAVLALGASIPMRRASSPAGLEVRQTSVRARRGRREGAALPAAGTDG